MPSFSSKRYDSPSIFRAFPAIIAGQSTRLGGVGNAPYSTLNLGLHTDDDPLVVKENRRLFFGDLDIPFTQVAGAHQMHGSGIFLVEKPGHYEGYDALVTRRKGIFLTVTIADCAPILIYDSGEESVAAIHAGWKGTAAGIVTKTLQLMKKSFGTQAVHCRVYIGTCIDVCSFEVDADVADHFPDANKRWDEEKQKFFVDLKNANRQQCLDFGIPETQIEVSRHDTVTDNIRYFSHRFEKGQTGRMLAVIGMKKGPNT